MLETAIAWVIVAVIIVAWGHAGSERLQHRELERKLLKYNVLLSGHAVHHTLH